MGLIKDNSPQVDIKMTFSHTCQMVDTRPYRSAFGVYTYASEVSLGAIPMLR